MSDFMNGNGSISQRISKDASPGEVLGAAAELLRGGADVCIATVIGSEGSSPSTPGQKLLTSEELTIGTVGGGAVEREAIEQMHALLAAGKTQPESRWYALSKDLAMACGGRVQLLFEPMYGASRALVVGAGHIGFALATLLPRLGFRVVVTDERPDAVAKERLSEVGVDARLGPPDRVAADIHTKAMVVVATHDHALDEAAIAWALERGFAYVGGVGSRGKAAKLRKVLEARGIPGERIDAVRMPIGLAIGGRSPEEIALAIAAELVAWRSGKLSAFV